jgi:hypothetical protein
MKVAKNEQERKVAPTSFLHYLTDVNAHFTRVVFVSVKFFTSKKKSSSTVNAWNHASETCVFSYSWVSSLSLPFLLSYLSFLLGDFHQDNPF